MMARMCGDGGPGQQQRRHLPAQITLNTRLAIGSKETALSDVEILFKPPALDRCQDALPVGGAPCCAAAVR